MCSTNSQIILREAYETTYEIFNHDSPGVSKKRPLALIAKQWAEDSNKGCSLYERMDQYHECGMMKWFGMSWDRWIEQPHDVCEEQLRRGKLWGEAEVKKGQDLQNQLDLIRQGMGKT